MDATARILDNLLSNAIRFSNAHGRVFISCENVGTSICVVVADEGPGVKLEDREIIFRKFGRGSRQPSVGDKGAGMGLYISRMLAKAMGANLFLLDRAPGAHFALAFQASSGVTSAIAQTD